MRFPRGLARQLVPATAPREFAQVARNPERSVVFGGQGTMNVNSWSPDSTRIAYVEYVPEEDL